MNQGTIVQCIGAVVDVEFARADMPNIYDALKMDEIGLTLEVQQQLGDGIVRTIALGSSDGLRRGMKVVNTAAPIMVPVGNKTLGVWTAEFKVTNGMEADVVEAVGNGTFGKAFEVLNQHFAAARA